MKNSKKQWESTHFSFIDYRRTLLVYKTLAIQEHCLNAGLLTRVYTEGQLRVMNRQDLQLLRNHYIQLLSVLFKSI